MSDTKWTKGPWRAEIKPDIAPAKVFGPKHPDGGDYAPLFETYDHANARLISKAPEMAELLRDLCNPEGSFKLSAIVDRAERLLLDLEGV